MSGAGSQGGSDDTGSRVGSTNGATGDGRDQRRLGFFLIAISVLGIIALVAFSIAFSQPGDRHATTKELFSTLLPMLGTWVGTVLAFYFSKENFAAAAQQTATLVKQLTPDQRLQTIAVSDVMIPMSLAATYALQEGGAPNVNLKRDILLGALGDRKYNRLPIVDQATGQVKYVAHRSIIDRFIAAKATGGAAHGVDDLTLADLIDDNRIGRVIAGFGTVGPDAKLNAVKAQMDGNRECADVFVTQDGTKGARAIGWITNVIVAERSKL
jgi:hypothetical protein